MSDGAKWIVAAALVVAPGGTAADAFRAIQEACRVADATAMKKVLPTEIGEGMVGRGAKEIAAWREEFAAGIAKSVFSEAREVGDDAVVRCAGSGGEVELILHRERGDWAVASPLFYLVNGRALDAASGNKPVALRLAARSTNEEYGDTAFSFAHVTRKPGECANRMDVWYCRNGDLHMVGDGRIARVAGKDLSAVTGIPAGAAWKETLAPEAGGLYVLHCRRERHRDFFVKARAAAVDEKKADLEWALLGAGFGSPASIRTAQPISSRDGADGFDALCGKSARRSVPEPAPAAPGTTTPK
jgi:hypothetical protein